MHFKDIGDVFSLDISEHVNEPLEIAMRRTNPQKVDFFAGHPRVAIGGGAENQVVQYWSVGRDADAPAHHHRHLELVPVLVPASKGTLNAHFWGVIFVLFLVI